MEKSQKLNQNNRDLEFCSFKDWVKHKWSRNSVIMRTREYRLPLLSKINAFMIAKAQQHQLHTAPLTSTRLLSLTAHFTKLQPTRSPLTPNNSPFNIGCNITSTRLILHIYTVSDSFELWLSFSICHGWSWWAGLTHSVCSLSFPWTASV